MKRLVRYFLNGLIFTAPVALTLFVLWKVFITVDGWLRIPIPGVGFLVTVQGLVQFLTWNGKIYWVRKVPPSSPFGPFVNHNHFAGYVEMIIPVAIGLAFYMLQGRKAFAGGPEGGVNGPAREGPEEDRSRWSKGSLALFVASFLVVGLFFSLSRGGILSAVASAAILFALLLKKAVSRPLAWSMALLLPSLAIALIAWIGPDLVTRQLGTFQAAGSEASFRVRALVWESLVRHLGGFVWVGSGLGTFEDSFAPLTPPGSVSRWDRAHNDYLQLLWETGLAGFAFFLVGAVILIRRYWWPAIRSQTHPLDPFRAGIAVSLTSIALHSLVDFNLQIGANGFLFALLTGLLVGLDGVCNERVGSRPVLVGHPDVPS